MTQDQVGGVIRALLSAAGGYLAGKGLIDTETWLTISGAVLTLFTAGWSWWTNRPEKLA